MPENAPLKVPGHPHAVAAGPAESAAGGMPDLAVDHAPLSKRTTCGDNMSHNASDAQSSRFAFHNESRKPVRESKQSVHAQNRQSDSHTETTLAHRAALNRLNGVSSKKPSSSDNSSLASTQPVLVKTYSGPDSAKTADMGKRRKPIVEVSELPPLESFSFQDILKEIDPDIKVSIDAIAEIYGRSKLSLADEYGSHRPPLGGIDLLASSDHTDALEAIQGTRLEPVEEISQAHSRRHSLALVGTTAQPKSGLSSNAAAATFNTTSVSQQRRQSASASVDAQADTKVALLPYIMSWLRNSNGRNEGLPAQLSTEPRAAESLHRILGSS